MSIKILEVIKYDLILIFTYMKCLISVLHIIYWRFSIQEADTIWEYFVTLKYVQDLLMGSVLSW